ncbi:hypothetical protein HRJ34_02055 [Rhizorhabdus wittichii]|uniref:Uncharacterized protein n=1 Tax=Rhizorhabdus wittichii TaxID=160791 RepID=A0A975D3V3_9SPHN|nr:hypothetical protein [Rhizorhabdus wittichii]QTH22338.1 hypothetical protein HRJ34_02055 [Rhizorhabdus wittichii]
MSWLLGLVFTHHSFLVLIAAAKRMSTAARRMEEANAQVSSDDRVDGDWFARLNDLAGLRP